MAPTTYTPRMLKAGGFWTLIIAVPGAIVLLCYVVSHWGWWKLHRRGPRPPLIRTWHGWIEVNEESKRERKRLKKSPRQIPRSPRSNYSWIFWDPTGEGQRRYNEGRERTLLRYLPRWMRSSPFASNGPASHTRRDLEAERSSEAQESDGTSTTGYLGALSLLGRGWRRGWRRRSTWANSSETRVDMSNSGSEQSADSNAVTAAPKTVSDDATVKMRKRAGFRHLCWEANSEDVERATNTQLLAPTAGTALVSLFQREVASKSPDTVRLNTSQSTGTLSVEANGRRSRSISAARTLLRLCSGIQNNTTSPNRGNGHDHSNDHSTNLSGQRGTDENTSLPTRGYAGAYGTEEDLLQSMAASLVNIPGTYEWQTLRDGSDVVIPKKRNKGRSTDDTAAAERMSMIDVPADRTGSRGDNRGAEMEVSDDRLNINGCRLLSANGDTAMP
ncbi:MAG: hypothetical protein Q9222_004210 [Ikaeria aurantiellina]